jgi:8-oxo-dGTP pyrophosphatase MutT (NUDIX family)
MSYKWKKLNSLTVYDSPYMRIRKDIIEMPNGDKKEWTYWDSADSAMVIGKTKDNKLVMIKQYRYLVDEEVIEFPSGHLDGNESVFEAAKREFSEETNYVANKPLISLGAFYETYGQLNRKIHLFYADEVIKSRENISSNDNVKEDIEVVLVDFDEAVTMALDNKIVAMGSSLAILLLSLKNYQNL